MLPCYSKYTRFFWYDQDEEIHEDMMQIKENSYEKSLMQNFCSKNANAFCGMLVDNVLFTGFQSADRGLIPKSPISNRDVIEVQTLKGKHG